MPPLLENLGSAIFSILNVRWQILWNKCNYWGRSSGGFRGAHPMHAPMTQNVLNFLHLFINLAKSYVVPPLQERIGVPSYGESASAPVIYKFTGSFTLWYSVWDATSLLAPFLWPDPDVFVKLLTQYQPIALWVSIHKRSHTHYLLQHHALLHRGHFCERPTNYMNH